MICYLIRHGKDDDSVRGGWSNSGLTAEGKMQVRNLADYIGKNKNELNIDRLFSSDLPRAAETALPISEVLGLEVDFRPEFRETNNGVLAGMPNDIANEKYPGLYWRTLEWDEAYPQGESPRIFYERIKTAWENFSDRILNENKSVILVTHGGVINVIYCLIENKPFSNKMHSENIAHAVMIPLKYKNNSWQFK